MAGGSIGRIADILKANVHDWLDRMEDPQKLVRQVVRDMEDAVVGATDSVGAATANRRRIEKRHREALAEADQWNLRAEDAVKTGDERAAREALAAHARRREAAEVLQGPLAESRQAESHVREHLRSMHASLVVARSRQGDLVARLRAAQGSQAIGPPLGVDTTAVARFDEIARRVSEHQQVLERMQYRIEATEATAEAQAELSGTGCLEWSAVPTESQEARSSSGSEPDAELDAEMADILRARAEFGKCPKEEEG